MNLTLALQPHFLQWRFMRFGKELFICILEREKMGQRWILCSIDNAGGKSLILKHNLGSYLLLLENMHYALTLIGMDLCLETVIRFSPYLFSNLISLCIMEKKKTSHVRTWTISAHTSRFHYRRQTRRVTFICDVPLLSSIRNIYSAHNTDHMNMTGSQWRS